MAKRCTGWSERVYFRFLANGRGQGELDTYLPWITIYDFPSNGKVARILGNKTHRIHHLLSQMEKAFFLYLDNLPDVEDIKEQFPIPLYHSQIIAAELGIRHPEIHGFPYVMTTDFLYKEGGVWHAVQIKKSEELSKPRVQEKFAIEKRYYEMIQIDWRIITEKNLPKQLADNYFWLSSGENAEKLVKDPVLKQGMTVAFLELYDDITVPFHTILFEMDRQCDVPAGSTMQIFKELVREGTIELNLSRPINLDDPRIPLIC